MNAMNKIDLSKVSLADKIRALCLQDPYIHSKDIAKIVKESTPRVSSVRTKMGLQRIPDGWTMIKHLSPENRDWVTDESEALGVSIRDLLDAIVTDARNGD